MSTVIVAAETSAIKVRYTMGTVLPARQGVSLLRRAQGVAAGLLFLSARVPIYVGVLLFGALVSLLGTALYVAQAVGRRLMRPAGTAVTAALALVCIVGPQRARADTITPLVTAASPLHESAWVFGSEQTNLYSFQTDGAGTLSISLKDWGFPVALQKLTASILSPGQVLQPLDPSTSSPWQFDVPISSGGLFDAFVDAQAGTLFHGYQLGFYSMSITFEPATTPVPLPPALDLLLGGMGLLGAVTLVERVSRRRNRDVISIA